MRSTSLTSRISARPRHETARRRRQPQRTLFGVLGEPLPGLSRADERHACVRTRDGLRVTGTRNVAECRTRKQWCQGETVCTAGAMEGIFTRRKRNPVERVQESGREFDMLRCRRAQTAAQPRCRKNFSKILHGPLCSSLTAVSSPSHLPARTRFCARDYVYALLQLAADLLALRCERW